MTAGRNAARRARYSRAEAEVEFIVLAISSMHADTGSYPPSAACYLEDPSLFNHEPGSVGLAALRMAAAPSYSGVNARRWNGPYLMSRMTWEESGAGFLDLIDPWGNPYFYFVFRNAVGTAACVITPEEDSGDLKHLYSFHYYFPEAPASARIRIINTAPSSGGGMRACDYYLNPAYNPQGRPMSGHVTDNSDFRDQVPLISNPVNFAAGENVLNVWPRSKPFSWNIFTITAEFPEYSSDEPVRDIFVVGSFGANGGMHGIGFDEPIVRGALELFR